MWNNRVADDMLWAWVEMDIEAAEKWIDEEAEPQQREELRNKLHAARMRTLEGSAATAFIRDHPRIPRSRACW